jgi:ABC-type branched-subunit amino acid transport system ATPase component
MLAVGRAIVEPRELILIDEPSKGLAPAIVRNPVSALRELKAQRTPDELVAHDRLRRLATHVLPGPLAPSATRSS